MSLRKDIEWRILNIWNVIDTFIRVKLLRDCKRDCTLCAIGKVIEWHYDKCPICQSDNYPCSVMAFLHDDIEQHVIKEMFPDIFTGIILTDGNGKIIANTVEDSIKIVEDI